MATLEDQSPELRVGPEGQVVLSGGATPAFGFASFGDAVPRAAVTAQLLADCRAAFTARAQGDGEAYSAGETFWICCDEGGQPARCQLEYLARRIFWFHAGRLGLEAGRDFVPATSGAEWWCQCIEPDAEIGFHWDKDYELEEESEIDLFPHLGTVTYLSAGGVVAAPPAATAGQDGQVDPCAPAPTVFLAHSPTPPHAGGPADGAAADQASPYCGAEISAMWVSGPALGKHVCFNGTHLHGAPDILADMFSLPPEEVDGKASKRARRDQPTDGSAAASGGGGGGGGAAAAATPDDGARVTFLVNLWFNWKPLGAEPISDKLAAGMGAAPTDPTTVLFHPQVHADALHALDWRAGAVSDNQQVRRRFEQRDLTHRLEVPLPAELPVLPVGVSVEVVCGPPPACPRVVLVQEGEEDSEEEDSEEDAEEEDEGGSS